MRIGIIAAMPGELKPLVKGWKRMPVSQRTAWKWLSGSGDNVYVAVCAGMGAAAATRAFAEAEADGPLSMVLSIGWAGALREGTCAGEVMIPDLVVDAQTGERMALTPECRSCVLVTTAQVAGEREKRRLAATYGGVLVDMEAATVVRLAQMRGISVCCIKVITDEVGVPLPDLNVYIDKMGQMQTMRFLGYIAVRPKYWKPLLALGTSSARGAKILASMIYNLILNPSLNIAEVNRTGTIQDWQV